MSTQVTSTAIPDVLIIEPKVFGDDRGFFFESFNQSELNKAIGSEIKFVQDNHSKSKKGVLRGLHYQMQQTQGKLVRVTVGAVYDVAVDMRESSATFGKWVGIELSAENKKQLWVPPGFAHGFLVISDDAEFLYKTTDYYHPQSEQSLRWDDSIVDIQWPRLDIDPVLNLRIVKACPGSWPPSFHNVIPLPSIFFTESSRNIGGQELQLLQQMQELKNLGFQTSLFCKKKSQIAIVAQNRHLTHIKLPFKNALDIFSIVEIYRQARKIKPSVIICHSGHDAAIASWVKVLLGLSGQKIGLLRMRTYQPGIPGSFSYRYIFDKACTPSQYLRRILLGNPKIPSAKLGVLYPGIDFDRLNSSSRRTLPDHLLGWLSKNPGPVIAHGAILRGEKNHSFMLGVIKKLTLKHPDVRYVIAGHGPMEPELRKEVIELQLEKNVYFAGMLDSIGPLLKISTLAVLPSIYEPLGMFQIEAQHMKVPVVVSDVGGIPETVINGDTGYVLSLNNNDVWVESLNHLLTNQSLREEMGKKGRDFVLQRFSKNRNTEELVNIIQSL